MVRTWAVAALLPLAAATGRQCEPAVLLPGTGTTVFRPEGGCDLTGIRVAYRADEVVVPPRGEPAVRAGDLTVAHLPGGTVRVDLTPPGTVRRGELRSPASCERFCLPVTIDESPQRRRPPYWPLAAFLALVVAGGYLYRWHRGRREGTP